MEKFEDYLEYKKQKQKQKEEAEKDYQETKELAAAYGEEIIDPVLDEIKRAGGLKYRETFAMVNRNLPVDYTYIITLSDGDYKLEVKIEEDTSKDIESFFTLSKDGKKSEGSDSLRLVATKERFEQLFVRMLKELDDILD